MTREAYYAFEDAEVIFGAERMLEKFAGQRCKKYLIIARMILFHI